MQQARPERFTRMHGHDCRPAIRVSQEIMAAACSDNLETCTGERRDEFTSGEAAALCSCGDGDTLNTDELKFRHRSAFDFEAKRNRFADALDEVVQALGLCVASAQLRNRSDVKALFIAFDHDIKLALHKRSPSHISRVLRTAHAESGITGANYGATSAAFNVFDRLPIPACRHLGLRFSGE